MASSPNIIFLGPGAPLRREDGKASAAITPGHLIEIGGGNDFQVHGTAAAAVFGEMLVALEPEVIEATAKDIDEAYAAGDTVEYFAPQRGQRFYGLLKASEVGVEGSLLESDGAGGLQLVTTGQAVAFIPVGEAVTAGGAQTRVVVEAL